MKFDKAKLQTEIARRDMSIYDFAKKAGVSPDVVYRAIKDGHPLKRTIDKFASALGVEAKELMTSAED